MTQHGACQINVISLFDKFTRLVEKENAVDLVCLGFSKTFAKGSQSILVEKMEIYGLDYNAKRLI